MLASAACVAAALAAAACGGNTNNNASARRGTAAVTAVVSTAAAFVSPSAAPPVSPYPLPANPAVGASLLPTATAATRAAVPVAERDFAFDLPATLPVGETTFAVSNAGQQAHELIVVRLDGITGEEYKAALAAPRGTPPPTTPLKSLAALPPGGSGEVTVDLPPGTYGLVCFLTDPASGKTHAALGMAQSFTVR